ncbi:class V aminotransferase [Frondihabitans sp. PAMC 28766]|uniref:aminotransferase class V-fold PLP-dependent enzyme n=1 Tax=Frondihabitans sp. PAMC 28766 TaxID=1795630 RepID=UPI00078C355A|nr:aminotransferase class V-fold PLP-dependent enzyme [Frondihabitans sp. PAMC 28766]AMM21064.1 class V aminotransferase [Frondihabitans sp. PAMC 28766]
MTLDTARDHFARGTGYLAACTGGLPCRGTVDALRKDLDSWASGRVDPAAYAEIVEETRHDFARVVGVPASWVAIGSQTSAQIAVIAASVPDGAEVLCIEGDFSSVMMPFAAQAYRGVRLRAVPPSSLASSITADTWLVAYSLVQSATGAVADDAAVVAEAGRVGARTLVDLTQAAGVLPVDASRYDATVTHAYKWLCSPRGVAFATFSPAFAAEVRPIQAGWYAGSDVWASCYGTEFALADDARRFDVSPAWQAFAGARPALALFASVSLADVWRHAAGLGDRLCDALEVPRQGQAIVTWEDPSGADARRLTSAGLTVSGRAGRVRVAFHLWNDDTDVDRCAAALGRTSQ